ncbi:MAG: DUF58 domain-containing protein [Planctomyces sp.]|nr:DUF58 domain-containing protein [Planctomyces sp.]
MTWRARWLCLFAAVGLYLGLLRGQPVLALLSMSVLLWIGIEWSLFLWRMATEFSRIRGSRLVNGSEETGRFLWSGRTIAIEARLFVTRGSFSAITVARDVMPENLELLPDDLDNKYPSEQILAGTASEILFRYSARPRSAGNIFLPGFRMTFQDPHGFFRTERFLECTQSFRVLPAFTATRNSQTLVKRINALPSHGLHRLQRSGMGSELLELREYVPGDPPKSIAWKVSARRDKLMTRQYESEVPVRLQLFVNGSHGTRTGGFGCRLLDQMLFVAASTARSAISNGDPVGAILFDEQRSWRVPAAGGERGFYRLLEALANFSVNPSPVPQRLSAAMMTAAMNVCHERFPELLDVSVNRVPFTWFPILPWSRRQFRNRCRLAAALAEVYKISTQLQVQLMHDDYMMAVYLQHFLTHSGWSWMDPVVPKRGRGMNDGLPAIQQISAAMTRAVGLAKDNEVFVVFADLLDCSKAITHLLPSVKLALAKHHRVAFICPSPTFKRPTKQSTVASSDNVEDLLFAAEQLNLESEYQKLKRELGRLGASLSISGEEQAVHMILSQMNLARSGRTGVHS